jgi:hypothetical protein
MWCCQVVFPLALANEVKSKMIVIRLNMIFLAYDVIFFKKIVEKEVLI